MSFRVLVVEDEFSFRLALEVHIEQTIEDAEVLSLSGDPGEVDDYFHSARRPQLAIVDLQLPSGTGFDPDGGFRIVERIRVLDETIPVIVLTIRNDSDAETQASNHPSIRYLVTKPWNPEQLTDFINRCRNGEATGLTVIGSPGEFSR